MRLGKLGEQIAVKSEYAFSKLRFEGFETADKDIYYVKRKDRNNEADKTYFELIEADDDGLYIRDIVRGGITNDDARIPRNISE